MLTRKFIGSAVCVVALSIAAIWQFSERHQTTKGSEDTFNDASLKSDEHGSHSNQPNHSNQLSQAQGAPQLPYQSKHGALVKSLKGIYFDRELAVDSQGNLRVSSDIKDVFDFFFSAIEEEDLDVVLARIEEYLNYKLEEPALSQALLALASYVDYKSAVFDLETAFSDRIAEFSARDSAATLSGEYLELVRERTELVKQLRSKHLSAEMHEAFYAERELYDDYMLEKLQINADPGLSAEQKHASLEILDAQMPADFIERRQSANPVATLRTATESDAPMDPDELYTKRVSIVGEPAAQRLSELDAERENWSLRYNDYSAKRDSILANTGLAKEAQLDEIGLLRKTLFNEAERIRVVSLDQINNAL